jgi:hypothetical protein
VADPSLADLDRCSHGRHRADPCIGCPEGQSLGNPLLHPGQHIGYTYSADFIVVPEDMTDRTDPKKWRVSRDDYSS